MLPWARPPGTGAGRGVPPHVSEPPADGGAHSGQGRGRLLAGLGERLLSPLVAGEKKHQSDQPRGGPDATHNPRTQRPGCACPAPGRALRPSCGAPGGQRQCGQAVASRPCKDTISWPRCDPSSPSATPTSGQRTAKAGPGPQEAPLHPPRVTEPSGSAAHPHPPGCLSATGPAAPAAPHCLMMSLRTCTSLCPPLAPSGPRASWLPARTTSRMSSAPATHPHTHHARHSSVGQARAPRGRRESQHLKLPALTRLLPQRHSSLNPEPHPGRPETLRK